MRSWNGGEELPRVATDMCCKVEVNEGKDAASAHTDTHLTSFTSLQQLSKNKPNPLNPFPAWMSHTIGLPPSSCHSAAGWWQSPVCVCVSEQSESTEGGDNSASALRDSLSHTNLLINAYALVEYKQCVLEGILKLTTIQKQCLQSKRAATWEIHKFTHKIQTKARNKLKLIWDKGLHFPALPSTHSSDHTYSVMTVMWQNLVSDK